MNEQPLRAAWQWFFIGTLMLLVAAVATVFFLLNWLDRAGDPALNPSVPSQQLIENLRRTGRPVQALYVVEADALANGWTPQAFRLAGDLWREIGDQYAAAAYWERAALTLSDDLPLMRDLAQSYLDLGEYQSAADALSRVLALEPDLNDQNWAAYHLGLIRAAAHPPPLEALELALREPAFAPIVSPVLQALTAETPDTSRALDVGIALVSVEQWAYAEIAFEQAVADPEYAALALAYTGWVRDMQGEDGGSEIRRAIVLAPNDARVRFVYGLHLRAVSDNAASLLAFEQAVALDPTRPAAFAELARAYAIMGDRSTAQYWFESALALSNNDPRYQALLDQFYAQEADLRASIGLDAPEAVPAVTAEP